MRMPNSTKSRKLKLTKTKLIELSLIHTHTCLPFYTSPPLPTKWKSLFSLSFQKLSYYLRHFY